MGIDKHVEFVTIIIITKILDTQHNLLKLTKYQFVFYFFGIVFNWYNMGRNYLLKKIKRVCL